MRIAACRTPEIFGDIDTALRLIWDSAVRRMPRRLTYYCFPNQMRPILTGGCSVTAGKTEGGPNECANLPMSVCRHVFL